MLVCLNARFVVDRAFILLLNARCSFECAFFFVERASAFYILACLRMSPWIVFFVSAHFRNMLFRGFLFVSGSICTFPGAFCFMLRASRGVALGGFSSEVKSVSGVVLGDIYKYVYIHTHIYIYIYIYICMPFASREAMSNRGGQGQVEKWTAFCLSQALKRSRASRNLYSAPITGSRWPAGAFTLSGASWYDMTAPDPTGSSRWTRRATLQVVPSVAPQH